jgi:formylmethanofuran dehydrogenase subunit E
MARGELEPAERARLKELTAAKSQEIMEADLEMLFDVKPALGPIPRRARILDGVVCEACGERAMETRVRRFMGKTLCIPCFEEAERRM